LQYENDLFKLASVFMSWIHNVAVLTIRK